MKHLAVALLVACGSGRSPSTNDAPPSPCPLVGAHHDQVLALGDGLEDRAYFLYVPPRYRCDGPIGLLVDFHGTAGDPAPEEEYAQAELVALADQYRFILARPRSRSATVQGTRFYQWDINEGDLERNVELTMNLIDDLAARFPIDRARVYASGYSSGSNMAAQFLFEPLSPFAGIAPMAGGHWMPEGTPLANMPRVYLATGYRDYLWTTTRALADALRDAGLPEDQLFVRRSGGGHELHGWYFEEAWRFFEHGERPASGGAIAAPWSVETLAEAGDVNAFGIDGARAEDSDRAVRVREDRADLTARAPLVGTALVAATAGGRLWRKDATGWSIESDQPSLDHVTVCFTPGTAGIARGFAGGTYAGSVRSEGAWTPTGVPDYGMLPGGWINGADCRADGSIVVVGYWSAAISEDGGASWSRFEVPTGFGLDAWMAGVATSPGGATVIAGYGYLGRAAAGETTATRTAALPRWWNAVTAVPGGKFWSVGDGGAIAVSTDDGRTWDVQPSGTQHDLYAVHFADAANGAAVGRAGTVLVTTNGGVTWTPRPLGRASYLGAVYVDATRIWVGGEDGLIASSPRQTR